ncbi:MAG: ABC transporter ATP-binding protein, partial [Caulobacter sp.]|nr:ABC transporter ATP-binding protein [Vitreoscilla sp.]
THSVYEAVFLSQRVVVMGRPGRVADAIAIDLPWPREPSLRASPRFAARCARVSDALQRASDAEARA